jgi:LacI family transcriptional regulator
MPTINDVAKEAGVSITTVSRVMNDNYPVKQETKEKVQRAIKKLNFRPNQMARSLINKKTSVIGILVPGLTNMFFTTIVEHIEKHIKKAGYSINLCNTVGSYKEEKNLVDKLLQRQVDGIIVIDPAEENLKSYFYNKISEDIPLIIVKSLSEDYKCNVVCYDEEVGFREAFNYFIKHNHKKIAFIRGLKSISFDVREKLYKQLIKENSLEYENIIRVSESNSIDVIDAVEKEISHVLEGEDPPTAIFACNDLMVVGIINCCRLLKIKIPDELCVIGCDNTIITEITYPRFPSIDLGIEEVGHRAALEILDLIKNGISIRKQVVLDTKLVMR